MLSQMSTYLLVSLGTWFVWRISKRLLYKNPISLIPGPVPSSWWAGDLLNLVAPGASPREWHDNVISRYPGIFKFTAFFGQHTLFIYDPKALHHIVVKDQNIYEEDSEFIRVNKAVFGLGLLSTLGDQHRKQRKMLNPVFSIAHMRDMVPIFYEVVHRLENSLSKQVANGEKEIDILSWTTRTALELIGQSGLGYSFDSLEEDAPEHPFFTSIQNLGGTIFSGPLAIVRMFCYKFVENIGTPKFRRAVVNLIPWGQLHRARDMVDVMHDTSVEIFEKTKQSLKEGGELSSRHGRGKDIMSVLVKANMAASEEDRLPENELLAQISTLTFAAMDTTSNSLARILSLLSTHPDVQEKLRQEIREAREEHGGDLDYDALNALSYMDAVCRETLRLYATVPMLGRDTTKDMILPLSRPLTLTNGKTVNEIFVPKDTKIFMSLLGCNIDSDTWGPDAAEWKPDRWLTPLPESVTDARIPGVYSNLMTFLGGGRACIGFKFSQLEMKVVLCLLLENFKFSPTDDEIVWQWNGVVQPNTKKALAKGNMKPSLPVKMSLV
ncbi:hypothetical protein MD484_g4757, partial [Candolleomyces efflorescens]